MKYNIKDQHGNIVDHDISYQEALMYIDNSIGKYYIMEPIEDDE